jgi:ParB family chromosome partitioning protein
VSESIESLRRATLEVVDLPTDKIDPDPMNPNRVDERRMEALKRDIVEHGFVQPVVVRPNKKRWMVVDGEHRWIVLRDAGAPTTPCVIDDAPEDDARMRLLTLNQLRGTFAPVKLAKVLAELADQLDDDELRERLGMDDEEFASALHLPDLPDDVGAEFDAALEQETANAPQILRWRMGPRQARIVERVVTELTADSKTTRADALIKILSE